jgi:hypothetical protein
MSVPATPISSKAGPEIRPKALSSQASSLDDPNFALVE